MKERFGNIAEILTLPWDQQIVICLSSVKLVEHCLEILIRRGNEHYMDQREATQLMIRHFVEALGEDVLERAPKKMMKRLRKMSDDELVALAQLSAAFVQAIVVAHDDD